jgi:CRISPR-associated protein Cmr4
MYQNECYIIHCLTNMHVGTGGENYGVVDKTVQRDVITRFPAIHSSSLKGALREYMKAKKPEEPNTLDRIFGSAPDDKETKKGTYRFHDAHLLSLPVRGSNRPFYRAISNKVAEDFLNHCEWMGIDLSDSLKCDIETLRRYSGKPMTLESADMGAYIEDFKIENTLQGSDIKDIAALKGLFGSNLAVFNDEDFNILKEYLPIIARNHLENGQSQNLWYEEVVPRETRFFTFISRPKEHESDEDFFDNKQLQIGGNASIGYGLTYFHNLKSQLNGTEN